MTTVHVPVADLRRALHERFVEAGLPAAFAETLTDYFAATEAAGSATHGLARVVGVLDDVASHGPGGRPVATAVAPGVARLDGNAAPGLVVAQHATDRLIDLARRHGSALVAATGYRGNTGALGYFTAQAAAEGLIAVALSNCEAGVAPAGGLDPVLGTNPIALSFPAEPDPITLDIATSALSYGAIQQHRRRGEPLPAGVVIAADGSPSIDPDDADRGAQLPMAGHKGYGLGLMVELLAGAFVGAKLGRAAVAGGDGTLLIAVTVDRFRSRADVGADVAALVDELHASRPLDPATPVVVPGERSARRRRAAAAAGAVELDTALWEATCRSR